ncbi:MAG: non-ribosomal peptide synthetase, partial [Pyrinomonadaceae bacterium]
RLTYQELNDRANRLARHLQTLGVGRETRVAVCVERSLEMVVAILGIFKAGGAFVPLDPDYPRERLAFMLDDAQAAVLLTQAHLLATLPAHGAVAVCLDTEWETVERQPALPPVNRVAPSDLAYVIYTSGTTGRPKGVMVEHGGLLSCLSGTREVIGFTSADVVPCMASFSFDIFLFELFSALVVGGRVVLLAREHVVDIPQLAKTLEGVTFLHAVPSLMRQLVRYVEVGGLAGKYAGLTRALVGGDQVPPDLLDQMRRAFPNARVIEAYGPTEAAIICSLNPVAVDGEERRHIIGRPIAGAVLRVCDAQAQPVPIGVAGEIYIGGRAVARGYLGREDLTRRQFVRVGGRRFYRTGDLCCYLPDGRIEFLGRADGQVKIRGFRIELAEIEAALNRHEGVQEAVVTAREDTPGDKRLVAYFVPRPERETTAAELQRALRADLPEFMIPSVFVNMTALPLTPHRKIDRRALPAPDHTRPDLETSYVAPRDEIERSLADIWAELLSLEQVGIYDNFFQLGGHSLLATQVAARVRGLWQMQIPLRDFFESPTVAALASVVRQQQGEPSRPDSKIEALAHDAVDLDELLDDIDQLSEEEVERLLARETGGD